MLTIMLDVPKTSAYKIMNVLEFKLEANYRDWRPVRNEASVFRAQDRFWEQKQHCQKKGVEMKNLFC